MIHAERCQSTLEFLIKARQWQETWNCYCPNYGIAMHGRALQETLIVSKKISQKHLFHYLYHRLEIIRTGRYVATKVPFYFLINDGACTVIDILPPKLFVQFGDCPATFGYLVEFFCMSPVSAVRWAVKLWTFRWRYKEFYFLLLTCKLKFCVKTRITIHLYRWEIDC